MIVRVQTGKHTNLNNVTQEENARLHVVPKSSYETEENKIERKPWILMMTMSVTINMFRY